VSAITFIRFLLSVVCGLLLPNPVDVIFGLPVNLAGNLRLIVTGYQGRCLDGLICHLKIRWFDTSHLDICNSQGQRWGMAKKPGWEASLPEKGTDGWQRATAHVRKDAVIHAAEFIDLLPFNPHCPDDALIIATLTPIQI
jgi:hypothetical protein